MSSSNIKTYSYKVYGLQIESEVEIDEFISCYHSHSTSTVKICYGTMPESIKSIMEEGILSSFSARGNVWFHIKGVGTYNIKNGDVITVEPCENADKQLLNVYLMCSCLGFIMIQRDKVAIHGGTVVINNKAVIITGDRGAGKSTLSTAFRQMGYNFLADDVAATIIDEIPMVNPGFPYQKLCEDAIDMLGYNKNMLKSFPCDDKIKYMVPARESFEEKDIELYAIYEITVGNVNDVQIEEIRGGEKMSKLMKNIYRGEFLNRLGGFTPKYFKQCLDIAKHIKFYKIIRPVNQFTVKRQIELIKNEIVKDKVLELCSV